MTQRIKLLALISTLLITTSVLYVGCRKKDLSTLDKEINPRIEALLRSANDAPEKYQKDVQTLSEYLARHAGIATRATANILWKNIASTKDNRLVFFPADDEKGSISGFFVVNKKQAEAKVEYYPFCSVFKKGDKSLNCMQAFSINLMMNKTIKNIDHYSFTSKTDIPLLFKELKKNQNPRKISRNIITLTTGENTGSLAIAVGSCMDLICDWVEIPNFNFLLVCVDDGSGCFEEIGGQVYDPGLWFVGANPYENQGGGSGGDTAIVNIAEMKEYVITTLSLEPTSADYNFTIGSPQSLIQSYFYLKFSNEVNKVSNATNNYYSLFAPCGYCWNWWDYSYASLFYSHSNTSTSPNFLWWQDSTWLSDSVNRNIIDTLYNRDDGPDICKKSFKFKKYIEPTNGVGGWQVSGTKDIHMNIVDFNTRKAVRITLPTMYFGLPVIRSNGEYYSSNRAAEISADAVGWAESEVMARYHALGGTLDVVGMTLYFRQKINEKMQSYAGSATLQPGSGIVVTEFGEASYPWPIINCGF